MYITITNDNTIKSTPSRGFPDKDAGEKRQKQAKRTPRPVNITPEVTCNPPPHPFTTFCEGMSQFRQEKPLKLQI